MFVTKISLFIIVVFGSCYVHAKWVFAHFLVGNANGNTIADWTSDIKEAQAAHIDGFALNVASTDSSNAASLSNAFTAANNVGNFKLFLSFDYVASGAWSISAIVDLLEEYGPNNAYFHYSGLPLASTFEGPNNANDWPIIKQSVDCFFMPDWASIGPYAAVDTGVVDGLFSWVAWPNGASDMNDSVDQNYLSALNGMPYMMPVSPWFFTNLPGYDKNWVWRGDHLWYDRWQQVIALQPALVEILTWNDYGESHYVGPLRSNDFSLFTYGDAPYNYADNMPHDAWRTFLPYVIGTYKNGGAAPAIPSEQVVTWFRINPSAACPWGGTTGNTASQGQTEVAANLVSEEEVYYSALLDSFANVAVTIGATTVQGGWRNTPSGGSGIYHGSAPFNGMTGQVIITIWRTDSNGNQYNVAQVQGYAITGGCEDDIVNWNAYVGASTTTPI